ncbi:MAG: alpha/beta hydrolase [Rubrivivax sp.]|jgi:acetyl esterase
MVSPLLTPRMAGVLERIARARRKPFHAMTPQEARAAYAAGAEVLDLPRSPLVRAQDLNLPGGDGLPRPARLYFGAPPESDQPSPVLLYFHGGGFVLGGLDTHDSLCRQFALRSGAAVLALDYRLAPEHPFPAAWDDAWAALRWLAAHGRAWGLDKGRIAVGGDSAGGTLAAATALRARDAGLALALQVLITPGTSDRADTGSRRLFGQGFLIDSATVTWFFDHAVPEAHRHDPRFAPLEAPDLEGVCPALVLLAECDPVVDDGIAYADRLRMAGVPVELEIYRGVTHDFMKMGRVLPEASQALDAAAQALKGAWQG